MDPQVVLTGHPFPGILDRLFLEVVPEGKVAQHLEEGVVPLGVADFLQVVVLPPCTHAFLDGDSLFVIPIL